MVRSKMTSYSKTATKIWLYDVPRSIAEDLRIAFLQSTLLWQVSCAKSKTKACTEISAWTTKEPNIFVYLNLWYILQKLGITSGLDSRNDLSILTDEPEQTGYTFFRFVCAFWIHFGIIDQMWSNFRRITASIQGVRIFRMFCKD